MFALFYKRSSIFFFNKSEANSEPTQSPKMEFFAKIFNGFQSLIIFAKSSS